MKDASKYLTLLGNLIIDLAERSSARHCWRDLLTIKSRVKHEGFSFLTITLPNFCDEFFSSLEKGSVDSSSFSGWKKNKCLPAFLQGFTSQVFDTNSGRRVDAPSVTAIQSIRQVCYFFKKINLPCSDDRVAKAMRSYEQIDQSLKRHIFKMEDYHLFKKISRIVVSSIFPSDVDEESFIPHHGPGSTMEKLVGNAKYVSNKYLWYNQLNNFFSPGMNLFPNEELYYLDKNAKTSEEKPYVRVVHVPKTLKTPRVIAMEPVIMQMMQQSIKDYVVERIESSPITAGHVNFTNQKVNQDLALLSSKQQRLATIDLSAASDRVHNVLVKELFAVNPRLSCAVQSTRSPLAKLGDKFIYLSKFASMGSALCFPVESLVFFVICLMNRCKKQGILLPDISLKTLIRLKRDIYVYGDDIIIPVNEVEAAVTLFQDFGLEINKSKSYFRSAFRESCGVDAFNGVNITPIYVRNILPSNRRQASAVVSSVATANQLYSIGLFRSSEYLKEIVNESVGFVLPTVSENCEGLGWVDETKSIYENRKMRFNRNLQCFEVQTLVPSISYKKDKIDGVPALYKCLLKLILKYRKSERTYHNRQEQVYRDALKSDEKHLYRTPVRGSLTLKSRRVRP